MKKAVWIILAIMAFVCCGVGIAEEYYEETWENAAGQKGVVVKTYTEWGSLERTELVLYGSGDVWRAIEYSAQEDGGFMRYFQHHYDETGSKRFEAEFIYYNNGFDMDTAVPMSIEIDEMPEFDFYRDTSYGENGTSTDNTYIANYGEKSYWITRHNADGLPTITFVYNYDGSQIEVWVYEIENGKITRATVYNEYNYQAQYVGAGMAAQYDEDGNLTGFGIDESNCVRFTLDENGWVVSRTYTDYGLVSSQEFTYDEAGNVIKCVHKSYERESPFVYELSPDGSIISEN